MIRLDISRSCDRIADSIVGTDQEEERFDHYQIRAARQPYGNYLWRFSSVVDDLLILVPIPTEPGKGWIGYYDRKGL